MIVQEINLYQDRFKEKKLWLSATHLLFLSGLIVVVLGFSSYWINGQMQQLKQQNTDLLSNKEQSTHLLKVQQEKLQALLENNQVVSQIAKLSADIAVRKRIIGFVTKNQFGSGQGFSSSLSGLSEINISNVWLSEISLAEDYIKLVGSALKAETIPAYFNRCRQSRLFDGKVFDVFELEREPDQDWKVDFLIASRTLSDE